ncbi:hypothetical protein [Bosea sp. TAF32]|uniref:hypothetical protein n=1 Tax=Bosea sp. TAF32 TaxID=3237482 RepID=UPI003F8DAE37
MVPDPGALILAIAVALAAYALFRMCTYRDLSDIDAREFDETFQDPQDEARGRWF